MGCQSSSAVAKEARQFQFAYEITTESQSACTVNVVCVCWFVLNCIAPVKATSQWWYSESCQPMLCRDSSGVIVAVCIFLYPHLPQCIIGDGECEWRYMYTSSRVIFHMSYMSGSIANSELWLECLIASLGAITKDIIKHKVGCSYACTCMLIN